MARLNSLDLHGGLGSYVAKLVYSYIRMRVFLSRAEPSRGVHLVEAQSPFNVRSFSTAHLLS